MKRTINRIFAIATTSAFVATVILINAHAANVDGTWKLTLETPQGAATPVIILKQNGEKLTGTYKGRNTEAPLKGTIKGNKITFTVKLSRQGQEVEIVYSGTVDGDSMKGKAKSPQGDINFTGQKEKA
jgi:hypothetical protein